jgi:hypothetical protein
MDYASHVVMGVFEVQQSIRGMMIRNGEEVLERVCGV